MFDPAAAMVTSTWVKDRKQYNQHTTNTHAYAASQAIQKMAAIAFNLSRYRYNVRQRSSKESSKAVMYATTQPPVKRRGRIPHFTAQTA
ncbi:hypothetical protein J6590_051130, partial [Homalodisca vitripennis]